MFSFIKIVNSWPGLELICCKIVGLNNVLKCLYLLQIKPWRIRSSFCKTVVLGPEACTNFEKSESKHAPPVPDLPKKEILPQQNLREITFFLPAIVSFLFDT